MDQLNNWAAYYHDLNGDSTGDVVQTRIYNDINEITSIRAHWADPDDAAGNMVTCRKPQDTADIFTLRWGSKETAHR